MKKPSYSELEQEIISLKHLCNMYKEKIIDLENDLDAMSDFYDELLREQRECLDRNSHDLFEEDDDWFDDEW